MFLQKHSDKLAVRGTVGLCETHIEENLHAHGDKYTCEHAINVPEDFKLKNRNNWKHTHKRAK